MSYTYTKEKDTFTAIQNLVGGSLSGKSDGSKMFYDSDQTPPTQAEIDAELKRLQDDYNNKSYQRDRQYPSIGDQLDMQYWDSLNGTTTWKDAIAKIKADHPKP